MNSNNIIYDDAKDKNVANYVICGIPNESDEKIYLYFDPQMTEPVTIADIKEMYRKGRIIIASGNYMFSVSAMDNETGVVSAVCIFRGELTGMEFYPAPESNN